MIAQIEKTKEFYFNSFRERGLFSKFIGLEDDLESQYNKILKTQYNKGSQGFHFNIKTNIEQDNFDLYYSIDKANKIIKSENIKNCSLPISFLYSDTSKLEKFKKNNLKGKIIDDFEPIIVSVFIPINSLIVIDGNHRMNEAKNQGYKNVEAFIIAPIYNSFLMDEKSYNLYVFYHNITVLYNRLPIRPSNSLEENTYFGNCKFADVSPKKATFLNYLCSWSKRISSIIKQK
ncbi:MAG: hypothetical protein Q3983_04250 [Capnocytophaga sp.]|nr:hypothetical protein [Capnocytophaga sp.]